MTPQSPSGAATLPAPRTPLDELHELCLDGAEVHVHVVARRPWHPAEHLGPVVPEEASALVAELEPYA